LRFIVPVRATRGDQAPRKIGPNGMTFLVLV